MFDSDLIARRDWKNWFHRFANANANRVASHGRRRSLRKRAAFETLENRFLLAAAINEVLASHTGTDNTEYAELIGTPGESLDGLSLIVVEGDSGIAGAIDRRVDFGSSDKFGSNGFFLVGNPTGLSANYGVTPDRTITNDFFENSSLTVAIVETSSLSGSSVSGAEVVHDAVALTDGGAGDTLFFSAPVIGPDGSFFPAGVRRIADGVDTDTTADWVIADFNLGAANTPTPGTPPSATTAAIYEIQGAGHLSPFDGILVTTAGIVTAVDSNGFFLQDPLGDDDLATSDALFVFTSASPGVSVGDAVEVTGVVDEFIPGGAPTGNLSTTEIIAPSIVVISSGNDLPAATVIGASGRIVPSENIDDDAFATFEPTTDGIDFFESLEGMLVTGEDLVAVSGTNRFGEIYTVANAGVNATGISQRGTLNISPNDFNPERIQINFDPGILNFDFPKVSAGDSLGNVTGVVSYDFGNYQILPTEDFSGNVLPAGLQPETTSLIGTDRSLTVATYNVLNLDPNDGDGDADVANGRFDTIAAQIVVSMNAPDVLALQEIQDNSGSANDGITSADATLQALVDAIVTAGGPSYAFIDNTFIGDNTSGGQPGANIRTAFLYNPSRVGLIPGSVQTIGGQASGEAFEGARLPLIATFEFNGREVTLVNNHFSSKGGSAPIFGLEQPFESRQEEVTVNGSLDERQAQSAAVQTFVSDLLSSDPDANVLVLGDLNEFEFVSPVAALESVGLVNLTESLDENERYTFIFDGNSQSLDHILVSESLSHRAQVDIVHVNSEFSDTPQRASDHDPIVVGLDLGSFRLEVLHVTDQEGSTAAPSDITGASAVLNALRAQDLGNDGIPDNTLTLSSGDAFIPGVFFNASGPVFGSPGIADIQLQNEMGFQAIALGNHEFDLGTTTLANLISGNAAGSVFGEDFSGTSFPYLSTNLDFSTDANLSGLEVSGGQAPQANSVTSSVVLEAGGELIGIVGATTPTLGSISSPGTVGITPIPFGANPSDSELDALAAIIQAEVDMLLAENSGMNKVILLAHMQRIDIELALAERLIYVDIIVAGGSNTRLFDNNDLIRPGDSDQGEYPQFVTNAGGTQTAVVNTDGSYKYVGRLVIEFDDAGNIIPESYDEMVSGAYATDAQGVALLNAAGLVDPEVQAIVDAIEQQVIATEGNVFGIADVFLNGNRSGIDTTDNTDGVRTQETNLGNLTADANLAIAQDTDPTVVVSVKNGGGIRASIGQTVVLPGQTAADRIPNEELVDSNGNVVKPEGGISQNDIATTLAFNNGLTLLTLTKLELVNVLEHGISALPGVAGQFPQVSGVKFSFDPDLPAGSRIQNAGIFSEDGSLVAELVRDGAIAGDANQTFRVVTLNFLAGGGDGYPFPAGPEANRVDLYDLDADGNADGVTTGAATFANDGTEQDALAEYLTARFLTTPYAREDTGRNLDQRIQNLNYRDDGVFDGVVTVPTATLENGVLTVIGNNDDNFLYVTKLRNEIVVSSGSEVIGSFKSSTVDAVEMFGLGGNDILIVSESIRVNAMISGGTGNDLLIGGRGDDYLLGDEGNDTLFGRRGRDTLDGGAGVDFLLGGRDRDTFHSDEHDIIFGQLLDDLLNAMDFGWLYD